LPANVRKAFVYIGIRRSGKTWALYQRMQELMQQGITKKQLLYINFEDERLANLTATDLQSLLNAYWELYPELADNSQLHFFLDEIAEVNGWESFIRRLLDKEKMQLYLSGSSAKMLSKEIATNLRGRTISREIFPMDFHEYLNALAIPTQQMPATKQQATLAHYAEQYLQRGGFPETIETDTNLHRELLQDYMASVIFRDIVERHSVRNHLPLRQLLLHCLQNATGLLSVNKLFKQFKSRGMAISKDSLYQYLAYFEDAYCLFSVPVYGFSLNKVELKPKKIYPVDTGLITAYSIKPGYDKAALLETAVFLQLRRQVQDIHYFQTKQGKEVDFLTVKPNGAMALYQVSLDITDETTKEREIAALKEAMSELNLKSAVIITLDNKEELTPPEGQVTVMPIWEFLRKDLHS
jgi:predicted AAA+ superfamily ATPase